MTTQREELAREIWAVAGTPTEARCGRIADLVLEKLALEREAIAKIVQETDYEFDCGDTCVEKTRNLIITAIRLRSRGNA